MNKTKKSGAEVTVAELFLEKVNPSLVLKRPNKQDGIGFYKSNLRGRGMEYVESRPYIFGDELRAIDWRVSARLNKMHTKVYALEKGRPVYIIVDLSNTMFFGSVTCFKSVLAAKIAVRLLGAAFNGHDQVGMLVFNDVTEQFLGLYSSRSDFKFLTLLSSMCQIKTNTPHPAKWQAIFHHLLRLKIKGGLLYLISDFNDFTLEKENLAILRRMADIWALRISDPLENGWPHLGFVSLNYNNQTVNFDSDDEKLLKSYQEQRKKHMDLVTERLAALLIPMLDFSTNDNLDIAMRPLLTKRR
jgi:uncharacterized protein (DUF58 family)